MGKDGGLVISVQEGAGETLLGPREAAQGQRHTHAETNRELLDASRSVNSRLAAGGGAEMRVVRNSEGQVISKAFRYPLPRENLYVARLRRSSPGPKAGSLSTLEATQGQIDSFFSQPPYKCHKNRVASVGD